jgi:hypothetical protein
MGGPEPVAGWAWFDLPAESGDMRDELCRSAVACLGSPHGRVLLRHLQQLFADRRLSPTASDAELRHVEGQRSVVSHLLQLAERRPAGALPTPHPDRGTCHERA